MLNEATQSMPHDYNDLITLFNRTFLTSLNTELVLGGDEPVYLPADTEHPHHRIVFARGYFASALHEIAHWCIAGPERRLLEDYGYWYLPDGRNADQQAVFEQVEVKPQAVEWLLSASCGFRFQVSCDNLSGDHEPDRVAFTRKVRQQVLHYLNGNTPERAGRLSEVLRQHYGVQPLSADDFPEPF